MIRGKKFMKDNFWMTNTTVKVRNSMKMDKFCMMVIIKKDICMGLLARLIKMVV